MFVDMLIDPIGTAFGAAFMQRALIGGALAAIICALVGTWVVIRGLAFLGEAVAHGMLPGVAAAALIGAPPVLGAAVSSAVMSVGIGAIVKRAKVSADTATGLLFAGMLALGVAIVSRSRSFATDVTAILFGDILAIREDGIVGLLVGLLVVAVGCLVLHRAFVALAFDVRVATTWRMRPALAQVALVGLVTAAVVASYQAVGALLVVALLLAPATAARQWTRRIPSTMLLGSALGVVAVALGLLASWFLGTAGGASIALSSVLLVAVSIALRSLARILRRGPSSRASSASDGATDPPTRNEAAPTDRSPASDLTTVPA